MKYIIEIWDDYIIANYFILCLHFLKTTLPALIGIYKAFFRILCR